MSAKNKKYFRLKPVAGDKPVNLNPSLNPVIPRMILKIYDPWYGQSKHFYGLIPHWNSAPASRT